MTYAIDMRVAWAQKASALDLTELIDKFEPRLRTALRVAIAGIRDEHSLAEIARFLERGRIDLALAEMSSHIDGVAEVATEAHIAAARASAVYVSQQTGAVFRFDQVNERAVAIMRQNRLELVREFTAQQREVTRRALVEGITSGLNPRAQARMFRDSIGLTTRQWEAVRNYRRLLEEGSGEALQRALRDRRFDATVQRAVSGGQALTKKQIDRMVERYTERYHKYRSEVIARTEALRSVHQGAEEGLQQAIDRGIVVAEDLVRQWNVRIDGRQRDSHAAMSGQQRGHGESFLSGNGIPLRYPGDPNAPASETAQCRCAVSTRIRRI